MQIVMTTGTRYSFVVSLVVTLAAAFTLPVGVPDRDAFVAWLGTIADQWARVLKPNGSLFSFASPDSCDAVANMMRTKFHVLNRIRWVKENGWHRKAERESLRSFLSPWEEILFAEPFASDKQAMGEAGYDEAQRLLHQRVYAPIGAVIQRKREAAGLQRWQVDTACSPSKKPTGLCYRWEEGACLPTAEQYEALCRVCGDDRDSESLRRDSESLRRDSESLRREYESLRREYESLRRPFRVADTDEASDVWTGFPTVPPREDKHPCEKPVRLMAYMVRVATPDGGVVLDSFAGSGAVGIACMNTGRRFIGIEMDPKWSSIARRRISEAANHLFVPPAPKVAEPELFKEPPCNES